MVLLTILQIVDMLITVFITLVIIQFIIGLLMAFNVVSQSNQFAHAIYSSINALLEPVLAPVRRIMPSTGAIDFSPLVVIILLNILRIVLGAAVQSAL